MNGSKRRGTKTVGSRGRKQVSDELCDCLSIHEAVIKSETVPDVIILPELWSTGYALAELNSLASAEGNEEADFLGELARKYNIWFAGGSVAAKTEKGITNRAQIVDRAGRLVATYDKTHLVPMLDEDKYLVAGDT